MKFKEIEVENISLEERGHGFGVALEINAEENLHQKAIEIFAQSEDSDRATAIRVENLSSNNPEISVNPQPDKLVGANPSSRRDGLSIYFSCEGSDKTYKMDVYQHKGSTYLSFSESVD